MKILRTVAIASFAGIMLAAAGCAEESDNEVDIVTPEQAEPLEERTSPDPRLNTQELDDAKKRDSVVEPDPDEDSDAVEIPQPAIEYEEYDENQ
ncbi:hypothetical protein [Allohahella marinimesophila]|uniref:Secreted protein n=1 Tax=Allohahella marinimesophila TaxID=1054972 RepID=A0ABP7NYQ8_9GAMM